MTKNLLNKGPASSDKPRTMRVEVTTSRCSPDEAYIHDIPMDSGATLENIMYAVQTLYGHEGVSELYLHELEE